MGLFFDLDINHGVNTFTACDQITRHLFERDLLVIQHNISTQLSYMRRWRAGKLHTVSQLLIIIMVIASIVMVNNSILTSRSHLPPSHTQVSLFAMKCCIAN